MVRNQLPAQWLTRDFKKFAYVFSTETLQEVPLYRNTSTLDILNFKTAKIRTMTDVCHSVATCESKSRTDWIL